MASNEIICDGERKMEKIERERQDLYSSIQQNIPESTSQHFFMLLFNGEILCASVRFVYPQWRTKLCGSQPLSNFTGSVLGFEFFV